MENRSNIMPVLNALFVFEAAAQAGSFTAAARHLGMAQPSVSRFIANLEDHVGTPLFERHHNRVQLTDAGDVLYRAVRLGLGHIRDTMGQIAPIEAPHTITITCTHGFAHMWVLPRLESLKVLVPGCEIQITTSDGAGTHAPGPLDLEVRFGTGEWEDVVAHQMFAEEVYPVCAPQLLLAHGLNAGGITARMLCDLPLLQEDAGARDWLDWARWLECHGVRSAPVPQAQQVPGYHFNLQAAMEGRGVALAWEHLIEPFVQNGWLIEVPGLRVKTDKAYFLVHARGHPFAAEVAAWLVGGGAA